MRRLVIAAILALLVAAPAWADFDAGVAAYNRGDYAAALRELRPLAEAGDATAQYSLGVMYDKGQGVAQDYAEAVRWYRKAADQNDAWAKCSWRKRTWMAEASPRTKPRESAGIARPPTRDTGQPNRHSYTRTRTA